MKPFDIVFYKGNSIISRMIRKVTKSERYSHCAFILDDGIHCLELSWRNPTVISHFQYKSSDYDLYELKVELTDREIKELKNYIHGYLNSGYDFKFLTTRALNALFGTKIKNNKDKMNCDELIVDSFRHIGINLVSEDVIINPEILSTSQLLRRVK